MPSESLASCAGAARMATRQRIGQMNHYYANKLFSESDNADLIGKACPMFIEMIGRHLFLLQFFHPLVWDETGA